jgi:hypothetical protein
VQLAGNVGFLSPGVGYSWLGRRLEADLFLGWVPPPLGGEHIVSTTAKLTWLPWHVAVPGGWRLQPLALGFQVTYTYGSEYWVRLPARYPDDYYELPSALRSALFVGAAAGRPLWGLEEVALYAELVALDAAIGLWMGNARSLGPEDVFSVAVGMRTVF